MPPRAIYVEIDVLGAKCVKIPPLPAIIVGIDDFGCKLMIIRDDFDDICVPFDDFDDYVWWGATCGINVDLMLYLLNLVMI